MAGYSRLFGSPVDCGGLSGMTRLSDAGAGFWGRVQEKALLSYVLWTSEGVNDEAKNRTAHHPEGYRRVYQSLCEAFNGRR
jgi:hypothetical protein